MNDNLNETIFPECLWLRDKLSHLRYFQYHYVTQSKHVHFCIQNRNVNIHMLP